ncbi:MAG: DUF5682 family protein [Thermoanaerobaculia bacterium]|nr:DUF5682 family protein [Thermoanaerobaculia bacterium]
MADPAVFGIRHHGPGSARSLLRALRALEPDCVLVEGPPEADGLLPLAVSADMQPPVALLVYRPDAPSRCAFYPFAEFSPEWQAIRFAVERDLPVRFMDLPQAHQLVDPELPETDPDDDEVAVDGDADADADSDGDVPSHLDPLGWLGRAAGYADGESWWEHMVEHRLDGASLFAAIEEAMAALRQEFPKPLGESETQRESRREAYMRRTIRSAQKEGFERIAVVCGAWHAPALTQRLGKITIKDDDALLKGLPKAKVEATWVPWTYGRLAQSSGYGAGVPSPGWYDHLWTLRPDDGDTAPSDVSIRWLTKVARLLRDEDLDCSSAHVIEAVRLAESLAALRQRPLPSLVELEEASLTVMCFGEQAPLDLIRERLAVGERLGAVPAEAPTVPLQRDLTKLQRSLRMKVRADQSTLDLDLRKPMGLDRSHLLHRLRLLAVPWGKLQDVGRKKGTFHEVWTLAWEPELAVQVIEAAIWGNTVEQAAARRVVHRAEQAALPELSRLVDQVLLAALPEAVDKVMECLDSEAARATDVSQLMEALPPLANVVRYGNVRQTDTAMVEQVVDGLVARVAIGLAPACSSLDDDAAARMTALVSSVDGALRLLEVEEQLDSWQRALGQVAAAESIHGQVSGRCCRLLLDAGALNDDEIERRMGLALSVANEPLAAAAWLEGFLAGSGMVLLHDDRLWEVLDRWVASLGESVFVQVLPLIRRTFSQFSNGERRQMGRRAKTPTTGRRGAGSGAAGDAATEHTGLDIERGEKVLPQVLRYLGLDAETIRQASAK